MTPTDSPWLVVGRVRRAHGIRGEIVVEPLIDAPDAIFASGRRVFAGTVNGEPADLAGKRASEPAPLVVKNARVMRDAMVVQLDVLADRNEAERWRERAILIPPDEMPALEGDELFLHTIMGMRVERENGEYLGDVSGWYDLPQGLALEVKTPAGAEVIVPYHPDIVSRVDEERRVVVVTPPVGLFGESGDESE